MGVWRAVRALCGMIWRELLSGTGVESIYATLN